jgi:hypothetical protein
MSGRKRSSRTYIVELVVVLVLVGAIYAWTTNGGPSAFGEWFAGVMGAP